MNGWKWVSLFLCFSLGIHIVKALFDISNGNFFSIGINSLWDTGQLMRLGIAGLLTGAVLGGATSKFTNVNPLQAAGIGAFTGSIVPLFTNSYSLLLSIAETLDQTARGLAYIIIMGFIAFTIYSLFVFVIQMASGGWKSYE